MFSEEDVNDEKRTGRPSTSTTDEKIYEVKKMVLANRWITVREIAEDLSISIWSCHSFLIDNLGMRRVAAKFVPTFAACTRLLSQKQHTYDIAATVFPRSGLLWHFLIPETEEAHERTTLRHDWRGKDGIEGEAEQDTKKCFFEVLRRLEKTLAKVYNIPGGLLCRGQNRYSRINK